MGVVYLASQTNPAREVALKLLRPDSGSRSSRGLRGRFAREIRTGGVKINGYSLLSLNPDAPRAAWGLSGIGEEGHSQSIEFFCGARVVGVSKQDSIR